MILTQKTKKIFLAHISSFLFRTIEEKVIQAATQIPKSQLVVGIEYVTPPVLVSISTPVKTKREEEDALWPRT